MKLVMMGTGDFAVPTLGRLLDAGCDVALLVTQPDRPRGRHQELLPAQIRELATRHAVPVFQPENVNRAEPIAHIASLHADLLVVAAYGQILSNELLAVARLGGINLHASLLPRYRGAAPVNWALYHGETVTGVTVIRMTPRVDSGAILLQAETPIGPEETAGALEDRLAELGAPLVLQAIERLGRAGFEGRKQDRSLATRAPKLKKEDGQIDWSRPAAAVANQVRAMQPWPMPYTFLIAAVQPAPERLVLERVRPAPLPAGSAPSGPAGEILDASLLVVRAGEGAVQIERLRPAGKRSMTAEEFLRGRRPRPGDRFGNQA
jgi:methionyl-tRNA formyltransferase